MGKVVGIDLGTTNSCIAVVEGGRPVVVPNAEGHRTTPSVVAYTRKNRSLLVGKAAKRQAVTNPRNTFYSVKRFIGCTPEEVKSDLRKVAYGVKSTGNRLKIECPAMGSNMFGPKAFAPEEVSAQVLRKLADDASAFLGGKVTQAVVTVPAYFNDSQRQATKDAGKIAGLEVLRVVNEPTAAALAFGLGKEKEQSILVFDLGGGTFDVSVLQIEEGSCEVLATSGDTHLGGDDFDKVIVDHLAETFKAEEGIDLREDSQTLQRLKQAAEEAKIELSNATQCEVNLPFVSSGKSLEVTITRDRFEELSSDLIERCRVPVKKALADAGLSAADLDEVVMVGGSTRIPAVKNLVKTLTGKEPNQTVNPDEVVALGAAVQGSLLSGEGGSEDPMLLLDVMPISLGMQDVHGKDQMVKVIKRNTTIPAKNQVSIKPPITTCRVTIRVLQGEEEMASHNKWLADYTLFIHPKKTIEVEFAIDANGILNITAWQRLAHGRQPLTMKITLKLRIYNKILSSIYASDEDYSLYLLYGGNEGSVSAPPSRYSGSGYSRSSEKSSSSGSSKKSV